MKKFILGIILPFVVVGLILLDKQFSILSGQGVFQTVLNRNSEIADPELKIFNVLAKNCRFEPDVLNVKSGDRVRIYVKGSDAMYGFTLPDYHIDEIVDDQKQIQVDFQVANSGEFQFYSAVYCSAPVEKPGEARGKLVVE